MSQNEAICAKKNPLFIWFKDKNVFRSLVMFRVAINFKLLIMIF